MIEQRLLSVFDISTQKMKPKRYAPLNVSGNELNGFVTAECQQPSEIEWHLVLLRNHLADSPVDLLRLKGSSPVNIVHTEISMFFSKILWTSHHSNVQECIFQF